MGQEAAFAFSDDGSQLAIRSKIQSLDILDLRSIRAELSKMNLDWDLPSFPPAKDSRPTPIAKIDVDLNFLQPLPANATPEQGIAYWAARITEEPDNEIPRLERARLHAAQGRFAEALDDYTNGLKINPRHPYLLAGSALMHVKLNHGDEAGRDAELLASLAPGEFDAHQIAQECEMLARRFSFETGNIRRPDEALLLAKRADILEPKNGHHLWHLGFAYCRLKQWDDAVRTVMAGTSASPAADWRFVHLVLALAEYHRGNLDKAKSCWEKVRAHRLGRLRP